MGVVFDLVMTKVFFGNITKCFANLWLLTTDPADIFANVCDSGTPASGVVAAITTRQQQQ